MKDPSAAWDGVGITTHGRGNHAVRDSRWRYIRYDNGGEELYDHQSDPNEWTNLAKKPGYEDIIRALSSRLPTTKAPNAPSEAGGRRTRRESGVAPTRPAAAAPATRPKIRLVFCETANDKPIARRRQIIDLPTAGCPDVEFAPVRLMDSPPEADAVLANDAEVQGYLLCLQGLGWRNDIVKLCGAGKPTLIVATCSGAPACFAPDSRPFRR